MELQMMKQEIIYFIFKSYNLYKLQSTKKIIKMAPIYKTVEKPIAPEINVLFMELLDRFKEDIDDFKEELALARNEKLMAGLERSDEDIKAGRVHELKDIDDLDKIWAED